MQEQCGTKGYLAPEVAKSSKWPIEITSAVDMWALGIVLFELTVGFNPAFTQRSFQISFGRDWDNKDPLLRDLIQKCLNCYPTERISAKEALAHAVFTQ